MKQVTRENLQEHRMEHTKANSWWEHDVRGIPLCRVCDECEKVALKQYKPEVLGHGGKYEDAVEEQIEADY